jgi:single-strand DNA-binding protein
MSDIAHVTLTGRIGKDPEQRQVGERVLAEFSLAVSESKLVDGEWKEQTSWFRVVAWDALGKRILGADGGKGFFTKGMLVAVSGRIRIRQGTGREGNRWTSVDVTADQLLKLREPRGAEDAPARAADHGAPAGESRRTVIHDSRQAAADTAAPGPSSTPPASPAPSMDDEPPF